ncbi:hypothetical protein [Streptomyces sp. NPDC003697]
MGTVLGREETECGQARADRLVEVGRVRPCPVSGEQGVRQMHVRVQSASAVRSRLGHRSLIALIDLGLGLGFDLTGEVDGFAQQAHGLVEVTGITGIAGGREAEHQGLAQHGQADQPDDGRLPAGDHVASAPDGLPAIRVVPGYLEPGHRYGGGVGRT